MATKKLSQYLIGGENELRRIRDFIRHSKHREEERAKQKAYYAANREKILEYHRAYYRKRIVRELAKERQKTVDSNHERLHIHLD